MSIETGYRYVQFDTKDQIIGFLTSGLKQDLSPLTKEIILSVISEIGRRFARRNVFARTEGNLYGEIPPDLMMGLKNCVDKIITKEIDVRKLGQDEKVHVLKAVCSRLRTYVNTLPTVNLATGEKQRQASSSSSFSDSSSSSASQESMLGPIEDAEYIKSITSMYSPFFWQQMGLSEIELNRQHRMSFTPAKESVENKLDKEKS
jgi:hypothetical protein